MTSRATVLAYTEECSDETVVVYRPEIELQPFTTYALVDTQGDSFVQTFTTGAGPVAPATAAPTLVIESVSPTRYYESFCAGTFEVRDVLVSVSLDTESRHDRMWAQQVSSSGAGSSQEVRGQTPSPTQPQTLSFELHTTGPQCILVHHETTTGQHLRSNVVCAPPIPASPTPSPSASMTTPEPSPPPNSATPTSGCATTGGPQVGWFAVFAVFLIAIRRDGPHANRSPQ